jgi:hypothetical protein
MRASRTARWSIPAAPRPLGAGALGRLLIFLEITVVGVALPAIQGDSIFGEP